MCCNNFINLTKVGVGMKMIFIGAITALGALVLELLFSIIFPSASKVFLGEMSLLLILGILIEELFKLIIIQKTYHLLPDKKNIFSSSILIGIGFFLAEFILNFYEKPSGLLLYSGPFLVHLSTCAIFGYYFYKFKKTVLLAFIVLFLAFFLHFAFNASVIYGF